MMNSLKKQLIVWSIGLLTVVGLLAGGFSYLLAREGASMFLDQQLFLVAGSVDEGSQLPAMQTKFLRESREEQEDGFVIQVWTAEHQARASRPDFDLPIGKVTGYSYVLYQGEKWRAYTIVYPGRTVQISQSDEVRREIAAGAAMCALLPISVLFPLSWILVVFGVGRILKPLADVTAAVILRDASSLTPISSSRIPAEVAPLITEINGLLLRIQKSIESQRHFVLDAAHELRNPLAALQLQMENLSQSRSQEDLDARIGELRFGIQRASHIVGQLLKMARYEAQISTAKAQVNLGSIVKRCISDFIPVAEKAGIDLGMTHDETAFIWAGEDDLRVLFDNLLDNAIRYSQAGGQIDVSVEVLGQKALVTIVDNGPGIPEHLLSRVFDRFFRVECHETEGSGIGLAIVNAIVKRESAEIKLTNRHDKQGLVAVISFNIFEPCQALSQTNSQLQA